LALPGERVEKDDSGAGSVDPDVLEGISKGAEGEGTIKILNPDRVLRDDFAHLGISGTRSGARVLISAGAPKTAVPEQQEQLSLISFELAQQEYALPLDRVREIIPLPDHVSEVPRAETAVLGVVTLRDRLLPLVSLRALLGLPVDVGREEHGKVMVLSMGDSTIGMVADRTREILRVAPSLIDPAPALLTRGTGDAEITSICRLDQGRRLVAVLSPDRLFRSELVKRVLGGQKDRAVSPESPTNGDAMADEQFVIFRLGDQEYGLPIHAVDEIARLPEHVTRLPKSPAFIDGVMNLRGIVVPIVDLRRRFEVASMSAASAQRILILALGGGKTGFMVDSVSEVLKVPGEAIRPAPEVSAEQMRLIGRIANFDAQGRMILLVDPAQLLDRVEADLLAKFGRSGSGQASKGL
jgi:purine-binding chemotaxis protein CheW